MVLDFLVTSRARRLLLLALVGERRQGTVSDLARLSGVGFASAWREVKAMQALGLVVGERSEGALVFRFNEAHPQAPLLEALVAGSPPVPDVDARTTRAQLKALGAPLQTDDSASLDVELERAVVGGVRLARRDPSVARALPVCLYEQRDRLRPEALQHWAQELDEKQAVGFFLELTAVLSRDKRFRRWSTSFADRRRTARRPFFHAARRLPAGVARSRAPRVATAWGFDMNMSLETFRSTFEKHVHG